MRQEGEEQGRGVRELQGLSRFTFNVIFFSFEQSFFLPLLISLLLRQLLLLLVLLPML